MNEQKRKRNPHGPFSTDNEPVVQFAFVVADASNKVISIYKEHADAIKALSTAPGAARLDLGRYVVADESPGGSEPAGILLHESRGDCGLIQFFQNAHLQQSHDSVWCNSRPTGRLVPFHGELEKGLDRSRLEFGRDDEYLAIIKKNGWVL